MSLPNVVAAAVKNNSLARTRAIANGTIVPKSARIPTRTAPITASENNGKPADNDGVRITGKASDTSLKFYHAMDAATQFMPGMKPGSKAGPLEVIDQNTGRIKSGV